MYRERVLYTADFMQSLPFTLIVTTNHGRRMVSQPIWVALQKGDQIVQITDRSVVVAVRNSLCILSYLFSSEPSVTIDVYWGKEASRVQREEASKRENAESKAYELLMSHLDATQRESYASRGDFIVRGSNGERYLVGHNVVTSYDRRFCGAPRGLIMLADVMLAQKLWLESDANGFLRQCNASRAHYHEFSDLLNNGEVVSRYDGATPTTSPFD